MFTLPLLVALYLVLGFVAAVLLYRFGGWRDRLSLILAFLIWPVVIFFLAAVVVEILIHWTGDRIP